MRQLAGKKEDRVYGTVEYYAKSWCMVVAVAVMVVFRWTGGGEDTTSYLRLAGSREGGVGGLGCAA